MTSRQRVTIPGGHALAKDGGFTMLEPTHNDKIRNANRLLPLVREMRERYLTAVELSRAYDATADHGGALTMNNLLQDRVDRYEAARQRFLYALEDQEN